MKRKITALAVLLTVCLGLTGCFSATQPEVSKPSDVIPGPDSVSKPATAATIDFHAETAVPIISGTSLYDGGGFSLELPVGWQILTSGEYTDFSFYAFDPQVPERRIFFFCKLEPFLKSFEAKTEREALASMVPENDPYGYHLFAAMPVLYPATASRFLEVYNDMLAVAEQYSAQCIPHNYPDMNNITVLETFAGDMPCAPTCLDNSIVRATFTSDGGTECQGLIAAQVTDKIGVPNPSTGTDLGFHCVYDFMGVAAPSAEFAELEDTLLRCLSSFTFTQEYLNETRAAVQNETDAILAQGREMQAAYDSYNAAWSARQTTYDIISQKNSDAALGYDRLYDPDTGEVYRAETGFYDSYDLNREKYKEPDLQIVDDSTEDYYLHGVDYYIYK